MLISTHACISSVINGYHNCSGLNALEVFFYISWIIVNLLKAKFKFLFLIWQHKHLFICLQTSLSLVVCFSFSIFSSFSFCSFLIRSFSLACWADSASALAWLRPTAWWKTLCSCSSCPRRCLLWSGNRSWACSEINTWILNATLLTSLDRAAREFCNICKKIKKRTTVKKMSSL